MLGTIYIRLVEFYKIYFKRNKLHITIIRSNTDYIAVDENGNHLGMLTYVRESPQIWKANTIDVVEDKRQQGVGSRLWESLKKDALAEKASITVCNTFISPYGYCLLVKKGCEDLLLNKDARRAFGNQYVELVANHIKCLKITTPQGNIGFIESINCIDHAKATINSTHGTTFCLEYDDLVQCKIEKIR